MELVLLTVLGFDLAAPTPNSFATIFLVACKADRQTKHLTSVCRGDQDGNVFYSLPFSICVRCQCWTRVFSISCPVRSPRRPWLWPTLRLVRFPFGCVELGPLAAIQLLALCSCTSCSLFDAFSPKKLNAYPSIR